MCTSTTVVSFALLSCLLRILSPAPVFPGYGPWQLGFPPPSLQTPRPLFCIVRMAAAAHLLKFTCRWLHLPDRRQQRHCAVSSYLACLVLALESSRSSNGLIHFALASIYLTTPWVPRRNRQQSRPRESGRNGEDADENGDYVAADANGHGMQKAVAVGRSLEVTPRLCIMTVDGFHACPSRC